MREPCVLALDIGTSSARSVLYDSTGAALTGGPVLHHAYRWRTTPDGGMEADADQLLAGMLRVTDAAVALVRERGLEVAAVATAAFWHSLLALGPDGAPLTPVFAWGDTRAASSAARLRARLDAAEVHRRTGCFLDASYPAARLHWLASAHPDILRRAAHWLSFAEYAGLRVSGELRCSLSMASGTGLLDGWRLRWDEPMLAAVGVDAARLSPLVDTDEPFPGLTREYAARWPELARIPWLAALGDGACANLGSGATGARRIGLTVGTTAAVRVMEARTEPVVAPGLWCYRLDRRRVVVGRALSNGGNVVAALDRFLRLPPPSEREPALAAMEPDAHGLTVLPRLVGERGPDAREVPGAVVVGQTSATRPIELLRAWLEAVGLRIGDAARALEATFGEAEVVVAGGGALNASPAWRQILADVLGRRLVLSGADETSARGAALVALESLGLLPDALAVSAPDGIEVRPDPEHHRRYRRAAERQRSLDDILAAARVARTVQP
jgi:gluconokinase